MYSLFAHITLNFFARLGANWSFVLMQYGGLWRKYRRTFHQYYNQSALKMYHPMMYEERGHFLRKLRDKPEDFLHYIEASVNPRIYSLIPTHLNRRFMGAVIMRSTYGIDDEAKNTSLAKLGNAVTNTFAEATRPGRFLVGVFPLLKHVPAWFPGAGWKRWFRDAADANREMLNSGFDMAKRDLVCHPFVVLVKALNRDRSREGEEVFTPAWPLASSIA